MKFSMLIIFLLVFYKYFAYDKGIYSVVLIWGSFTKKPENHHDRAPFMVL